MAGVGVSTGVEEKGQEGRVEENSECDGHIYYLDFGDGFIFVNICKNLYSKYIIRELRSLAWGQGCREGTDYGK